MTHFVEAAGSIAPRRREVSSVYVKWDAGDLLSAGNPALFKVPARIEHILGRSVLMFPTLIDASRFLASRNAAIGSMEILL